MCKGGMGKDIIYKILDISVSSGKKLNLSVGSK
jgi:hypothetical protein